MATNVPYVTLNDGNKMPQVGFGLWKVDNATCADTVYNAIKTGYRLFDGACGTSWSCLLERTGAMKQMDPVNVYRKTGTNALMIRLR